MAVKKNILPETLTLGKFEESLDHFPFYIPNFQRLYRWQAEDHVEKYIEDIYSLILDDNNSHFFNSMVFVKDTKKNKKGDDVDGTIVIDGQQRLITTLLLLLAKRKVFGGKINIKSDLLFIENDRLGDSSNKGFNLMDIELKPKLFGFEKFEINKVIDEKVYSNWFSVIKYIVEFSCSNFKFINENYKEFSRLEEDEYFDRLQLYMDKDTSKVDVFMDNFEFGLKIGDEVKNPFLLVNALLYCLAEGMFNWESVIIPPDDIAFSIGCSIVINCDDKDKRELIGSFEPGELPSSVPDYYEISKNILNQILSFFHTYEKPKLQKMKNQRRKEPYCSNYEYILGRLIDKFVDFKWTLFNSEFDLNKSEFSSINNFSQFYESQIKGCLDRSLFVDVSITNKNRDLALDLALSAFMSINSTGEPLSAFDIVRSDLYKKMGKKGEVLVEGLDEFILFFKEKLNISDDNVLKFFFASNKRTEKDREGNSYYYQDAKKVRQYKSLITSYSGNDYDKGKKFIEEIRLFCRHINAIRDGVIYDDSNNVYSVSLHLCGDLSKKNETLLPVVHNIYISDFSSNEKNELFQELYKKLLWYLIESGSKDLTTKFARILKDIEDASTADHVKNSIQTNLKVNQKELLGRFTNYTKDGLGANFYNDLGRHVSILFEGHLRKTTTVTILKSWKPGFHLLNDSTIEHIIPQSHKKSFNSAYRIICGNLTLLPKSLNSAAGAKDFYEKIPYYVESQLISNGVIIQDQLDRYNKKKKPRNTNLTLISQDLISKPKQKAKYKVVIKNDKDDSIEGHFTTNELDETYLVGKWSSKKDDEIDKLGARYKEMIDVVLNKADAFYDALNELQVNAKLDLSMLAVHEEIE